MSENDDLGIPLRIVACIPIVGLILWVMNREKKPNSAKQAITSAIIGIIIIVAWQILGVILSVAIS